MQTEVKFELAADYVGPLEYYFFGDDDLWVFLDNELVCDIGGVHSSAGEYVNLWDYLDADSAGEHTLSIFYTERGASGSTCWMQFTLPSVSSATIEKSENEYSDLYIDKTVYGKAPVDGVYEFTLELRDVNGDWLKDDYSCTIINSDGTVSGYDLKVHHGDVFSLGAGQAVLVKYLPAGTQYIINESNTLRATETTYRIDQLNRMTNAVVKGETVDGETAADSVAAGYRDEVHFTNSYMDDLPSTGGSGTAALVLFGTLGLLAGAAVIMAVRKKETQA